MSDNDTILVPTPQVRGSSQPPTRFTICDEPWSVVLTPSFMQRHTPFFDLDDLIVHCGATLGEEDPMTPECEMMDAFIRQYTRFSGLNDFLRAALREWTRQHMPV